LLKVSENVYAVLLLFALTQGPVLSIWFRGAATYGINVDTAVFASYVGIQIPGVLILTRMRLPFRRPTRSLILFGLALTWITGSVLWATAAFHSLPEVISLILTVLVALYLIERFSITRLLIVALIAMQLGILSSIVAIYGGLSGSKGINGEWIGIYLNRNSFAPVAATGLLLACSLMYVVFDRTQAKKTTLSELTLLVIAILNVMVLLATESQTTLYAMLISFSVVLVSRILSKVFRSRGDKVGVGLRTAFLSAVSLLPWVHVFGIRQFETLMRHLDFNGREYIWNFNFDGFLRKPFIGWGWMSAWRSNEFLRIDQWWLTKGKIDGPWSHSSYFDILLGGGVVAALIFAVATVLLLRDHARMTLNKFNQISLWLAFFVLVSSTQESFMIGNHFMMVLFLVGLLGPIVANEEVSERVVKRSTSR
jgi:O-antigen ligase